METTPKPTFMTLPAELRCHIYTFCPELVYKHVFPLSREPPDGFLDPCSWPVYRMPTALLQTNTLVHAEVKDNSVQKLLQDWNDHYPPTIVFCPREASSQSYAIQVFLTSFYHASLRHDAVAIETVTSEIASFCRKETNTVGLVPFADQTLKRMREYGAALVSIRILLGDVKPYEIKYYSYSYRQAYKEIRRSHLYNPSTAPNPGPVTLVFVNPASTRDPSIIKHTNSLSWQTFVKVEDACILDQETWRRSRRNIMDRSV
jgi:hypothetical protein